MDREGLVSYVVRRDDNQTFGKEGMEMTQEHSVCASKPKVRQEGKATLAVGNIDIHNQRILLAILENHDSSTSKETIRERVKSILPYECKDEDVVLVPKEKKVKLKKSHLIKQGNDTFSFIRLYCDSSQLYQINERIKLSFFGKGAEKLQARVHALVMPHEACVLHVRDLLERCVFDSDYRAILRNATYLDILLLRRVGLRAEPRSELEKRRGDISSRYKKIRVEEEPDANLIERLRNPSHYVLNDDGLPSYPLF